MNAVITKALELGYAEGRVTPEDDCVCPNGVVVHVIDTTTLAFGQEPVRQRWAKVVRVDVMRQWLANVLSPNLDGVD